MSRDIEGGLAHVRAAGERRAFTDDGTVSLPSRKGGVCRCPGPWTATMIVWGCLEDKIALKLFNIVAYIGSRKYLLSVTWDNFQILVEACTIIQYLDACVRLESTVSLDNVMLSKMRCMPLKSVLFLFLSLFFLASFYGLSFSTWPLKCVF